MSEPSKLKAILSCRCPRCRKGIIFTHSPLNLGKFDRMYEACPVCGLYYEVEVGFFWGAMYISYAFSVVIVLITGVLLFYLANDPSVWVYLTVVALTIFSSTPILFRYARILLLYFFSGVRFSPKATKQ